MELSKCCKTKVWVQSGNEGTSYYVCSSCERACDTLLASDDHGAITDDTGREAETQAATDKT